jgi:hypothetical protein
MGRAVKAESMAVASSEMVDSEGYLGTDMRRVRPTPYAPLFAGSRVSLP